MLVVVPVDPLSYKRHLSGPDRTQLINLIRQQSGATSFFRAKSPPNTGIQPHVIKACKNFSLSLSYLSYNKCYYDAHLDCTGGIGPLFASAAFDLFMSKACSATRSSTLCSAGLQSADSAAFIGKLNTQIIIIIYRCASRC